MSKRICGLKIIFTFILFIIIVNGNAKDITKVKKGQRRLNEYISHYETLDYNHEHLKNSHNRAKRSVTQNHHVDLHFNAHGRDFHLRLKRDLNTFSDKLEIYDSNGPIECGTDHIYEGEVKGDPNSYVFGSIIDGIFEGKIVTERDAYYVEHAKRYFSKNNNTNFSTTNTYTSTTTTTARSSANENSSIESNTSDSNKSIGKDTNDFHSIIYKESHVEDPYQDIREGHVGGCGITDEVSHWMESIQNSAVEELPEPMYNDKSTKQKLHKKRTPDQLDSDLENARFASGVAKQRAVSKERDHKKDRNTDDLTYEKTPKKAYDKKNKRKALQKANLDESQNEDDHSQHVTDKGAKKDGNVHSKHVPPKRFANGVNDDFKYPYEKYTKDANMRFKYSNENDIGGGKKNTNRINSMMDSGFFYDPETLEKFSPTDDSWHDRVHERVRRASSSSTPTGRREDNKNTCSLYIQTDPLIWRHIREGIADHDRGRKYEIDVKTREEITSLIAHHVTAVNYIYRNTKFDGRNEHRNIRFEVQRIKIDDDSACKSTYNGPYNAFCNEHMDVSNFLNLHSLEDHSDFCLAYVFTYRDFSGGTLGLAWVASASGASGGICEKFKTYTETVGGQYQSTKRSLNTGIITFVNYNSRVPPKVSQLTLAHEIGHNFGSPHDYPLECRPGNSNGNYIMFASATSGDRPNNSKFSPCSIRNISNVLDVLIGNSKRDCFKASEGAFCGNKIVESGEECDCGFNEDECKDNCCYPRIISEYDLSLNSSAKGCTRRAKTQCSPSQGPCCLANSCTFVPANYHTKCKEETECSWSSTCNGTTAECPDPKPRDDKTKCNNGTALCIRGECSGSICLLWNMSECFLTSQTIPSIDKRKLCELACQTGNDSSTCQSTSEFADLYDLPKGGISLRPGSPCDNFQGYCDVFLKCRAVDADGPLVRLKNLLLNRETLLTLAQWITDNWYIVVLMGIGFILVMGAFIKCCAVHTPSSNPKKRRARRISETLRAPMNTLRRMRHPYGRSPGPRSIPPPANESRHASQHHQRHHGGADWDRRAGAHSIVPLPVGGPPRHHANRSNPHSSESRATASTNVMAGAPSNAPSSSAGNAGRSSRAAAANAPRSVNPSRSGHNQHGEAAPSGSGDGGLLNAAGSGVGLVSRVQIPLPSSSSAQTSQHHNQHYPPKEIRNKSRSYRSTSKSNKSSSAGIPHKDTHKSGNNRRKIVY